MCVVGVVPAGSCQRPRRLRRAVFSCAPAIRDLEIPFLVHPKGVGREIAKDVCDFSFRNGPAFDHPGGPWGGAVGQELKGADAVAPECAQHADCVGSVGADAFGDAFANALIVWE